MALKLHDNPCARCEITGVFGTSGELGCRKCNRRDCSRASFQYPDDVGGDSRFLNENIIRNALMKERPQAIEAAWRRSASLLLVALILIVLGFAGIIPAEAIALALILCALALTHVRGI